MQTLLNYHFQTGDIITARIDLLPVIYHKGVILIKGPEIYVCHNTPNKVNESGGNIVIEKLSDFIKSRTIVGLERTSITASELEQAIKANNTKQFDLINYNCEHFISSIKGPTQSSQLKFWIAALGLFVIYKIS
jgi:hypothetical protein